MDTLHPDILRLFEELNQQGVKYMVVGMSSAIMQGVPANTQDIDIWFEHYSDPKVLKAVNNAGGILIWRTTPPLITGSKALDTLDIVSHMSGLDQFQTEYRYAVALEHSPTGTIIPVLPLERVVVSKRAADRPKDRLAIVVIENSLHILRKQK